MIDKFFILSPRGDTIINKDFRGGDSNPALHEAFFRKVIKIPCMELFLVIDKIQI